MVTVFVSYPLKYMSLKISNFLLDFVENKTFSIQKLVPFGNIKWAFPVPSIKSAGPDIVCMTDLLVLILKNISLISE